MSRAPWGSVEQIPKSRFPCPVRTHVFGLHEEFILGEHTSDIPGVHAVDNIFYEKLVYKYFIWRI